MKNKKIIIGSRGSKLALIYAQIVRKKILDFKDQFQIKNVEIKKIKTKGDEIQNKRLSEIGGKGLFSKKIEEALLKKKIDIAVHALKDMPTRETKGLNTICYLKRNDKREVLISRKKKTFDNIPKGSVIGTSSFRREFQLKQKRNDLKYKLIRGNIDTRIKKLDKKLYDGIILAYTGIKLLGLKKKVSQIFSTSEIIPSAGQGIIAAQCRVEDNEIIKILKKINHKNTFYSGQAERCVLKVLDGDCETAVGVSTKIQKKKITIQAELFSLDGKKRFYEKGKADLNLANDLGVKIGKLLKKKSKNLYKK
tara:strand:+ start:181 stop:1104 length:924 start_codon:yes stop_codon:yes gene_type:complete